MITKNKGFFITLEGCEGTGKSTQAKKIYDYLLKKNIPTVLTREPGGCEESEQIRNLLISGHQNKWDGISETLLHNAARRMHIKKTIKPALNNNNWVICDRFIDSTVAYQGLGQGVPIDFINYLTKTICEEVIPDLTIVFNMDIGKALERTKKRENNNRYENFDVNFHTKVQKYFSNLKNHDERYFEVNADNNIENVFNEIIQELKNRKNI